MYLLPLLRYALFLLAPFCFLSTAYLYLYPLVNLCAFPIPAPESTSSPTTYQPWSKNAFLNTVLSHTPISGSVAHNLPPFRLLAIGDPQLEGTTSLDLSAESLPHYQQLLSIYHSPSLPLSWRVRESLKEVRLLITHDVWGTIKNHRKRIDLWGNDLYLRHLVRMMSWWARPTHISVLGDLLGSQWIDDDEFEARKGRFWGRVFDGYSKLTPEITTRFDKYGGVMGKRVHVLGEGLDRDMGDEGEKEKQQWTRRLITLPGNHDIGYGGDITPHRVARYEKAFGPVNYELEFRIAGLNTSTYNKSAFAAPRLRIVVLNNMNLDSPVLSPSLQAETYSFINDVIGSSAPVDRAGTFTLLLTHIPLHKAAGICVDPPLFKHHTTPNREDILVGGIQEQNHLSEHSSAGILTGIFGMSSSPSAPNKGRGRPGMIMTGHDHEGCDVWHYVNQTLDRSSVNSHKKEKRWQAAKFSEAREAGVIGGKEIPGLREVTVRSAMGDFGGNIGLLSLSFNTQTWEWESAVENCGMGGAWIWWVVHIVDLVTFAVAGCWYVLDFVARVNPSIGMAQRDRERERREWMAGRGYTDIYGREVKTLDGQRRRGGSNGGREKAGERPRSRGKDSGNSSGSDSNGEGRARRRTSGKRKVSLREKMGGGRRQLSAVLEMPEHEVKGVAQI